VLHTGGSLRAYSSRRVRHPLLRPARVGERPLSLAAPLGAVAADNTATTGVVKADGDYSGIRAADYSEALAASADTRLNY